MNTELQRVEEVIGAEAVTTALARVPDLSTYQPARMTDAETASLVDLLKLCSVARKKLEAEQREILLPFESGMRRIRERFAQALNPLKGAMDRGKEILRQRDLAVEARRRAHEEEARRRAEEATARRIASPGRPTPPVLAEVVAPQANTLAGGIGRSTGVRRLHVELVDPAKLAADCPRLLELKTQAALLELRRRRESDPNAELPGVRSWYEKDFSIG